MLKHKFFRFLLPVILLPLLFSGCKNRENSAPYVQQTDSLLRRLDSSAYYFNKIDTVALKATMLYCKEIVEKPGNMKSKQADSLLLEFGHRYRIYKHFLKKYGKLKKELTFSKNQLQNLRHDLQYELIEKGKDSLYYNQERKALNHLRREISLYYQRILEQNRQMERLKKITESLESIN